MKQVRAASDVSLMNDVLFLMPNWKWAGIVIAILAGFLLKSLLRKFLFQLKKSPLVRNRAEGFVLHFIETDLQSPLAWVLTSLFWTASIDALALPPVLNKYCKILVHLVLALNLIILLYRAVEALGKVFLDHAAKTPSTLDDALAPMATKILKVLVVVVGVLIAMQNFGLNVVSLLAGLGLGGLALALAAQDTAANFFGSVTIMADRPFQVGDWIKIGDSEGVVEEIGIRSTRIKTFTNSIVTVPNSIIAKEKVENIGIRTSTRVRHYLGIAYETPHEKMKLYLDSLKYFLTSHPDIIPDQVSVSFSAMGDFSLQIFINFFVKTVDMEHMREVQQDFLYYAMQSAAHVGVEFAYPTATHILKTADVK